MPCYFSVLLCEHFAIMQAVLMTTREYKVAVFTDSLCFIQQFSNESKWIHPIPGKITTSYQERKIEVRVKCTPGHN